MSHCALRVAMIGAPNVGKSALTNALIRTNVCAVSKLIDTTRRNTVAALTEDMFQLVVVDSPGLIGTGHARKMAGVSSDEPILAGPAYAIERAEHILVVHDVTMPGKFLSHRLLYFLNRFAHIPTSLVLNKVDLVTDRGELAELAHILTEGTVGGHLIKTEPVKLGKLGAMIARNRSANNDNVAGGAAVAGADGSEEDDDAVVGGIHPPQRQGRDAEWHRQYNQLISIPAHRANWTTTRKLFGDQLGWPQFSALFFASALRGDGIDPLRQHLRSVAKGVDKWRMRAKDISTSDPRMLCAEHTRSALLNRCPAYIAYALRTRITEWEESERGGTLRIAVDVFCDKERWVTVVGSVAEEIEREQCELMARLFGMPVQFRLFICGPDRKRRHVFNDGAEQQQRHGQENVDSTTNWRRGPPQKWRRPEGEEDEMGNVNMTFEQHVLLGRVAGGNEVADGTESVAKRRPNYTNKSRKRF
ncbi:hypothetical protein niasHT_016958 [Heterodera trifolii]|uniref:G domain-containing protein n=1 Tax=Heterodera trifolii TaxID=157864 RepID=A0ABD2LBA1_9BILA